MANPLKDCKACNGRGYTLDHRACRCPDLVVAQWHREQLEAKLVTAGGVIEAAKKVAVHRTVLNEAFDTVLVDAEDQSALVAALVAFDGDRKGA